MHSHFIITLSKITQFHIQHCNDELEHRSGFELTIDTPKLTLMGELWSVYCEYLGDNYLCFTNGTFYFVPALPCSYHTTLPSLFPIVNIIWANNTLLWTAFQQNNLTIYVLDIFKGSNTDGSMEKRHNSSALAMELRLSCINPSICTYKFYISIVLARYKLMKFALNDYNDQCFKSNITYWWVYARKT